MPNTNNWLSEQWQHLTKDWLAKKEDQTVPLDQVSRFYQSDFYHSLDAGLKSAFYDGPLGGLDARIIERKDLEFIQNSYQLWESGRNVSCAIYGEKGTGLSTLLNVFVNDLKQKEKPYKLLPLNKRLSNEKEVINAIAKTLGIENKDYKLDDFIDLVNELPPMVIAIDNVHLLVQRTLAAQAVVDCFSAVILASRGHHFWLLAAEDQAWRRLCYGYSFENLISHQQHVTNFSESQMRELLIGRFSYAGFNIINDIPIDKLHKEKSPLYNIAKRSKGCVELGLFYCLNHLTHGTKPQSIFLMEPAEIDTTPLKKLTQSELFTLAEISTHGQLAVREHAKVFRMTHNESKMILEHLRVLGILDITEDNAVNPIYQMKLIICAVVIRYLISMNYLY